MAKYVAQEARTLGVTQLFAPVVDLARELRFGRVGHAIDRLSCRELTYLLLG